MLDSSRNFRNQLDLWCQPAKFPGQGKCNSINSERVCIEKLWVIPRSLRSITLAKQSIVRNPQWDTVIIMIINDNHHLLSSPHSLQFCSDNPHDHLIFYAEPFHIQFNIAFFWLTANACKCGFILPNSIIFVSDWLSVKNLCEASCF